MQQQQDFKGFQDGLGRKINYVRISVTDRCDFRCIYCMSEKMEFLPKQRILTLEEIGRCAALLVENGVSKIRLTGGEPLTRRGITDLCSSISTLPGLKELVITTNGSQLRTHARALAQAGVRRLNISLDTLDPQRFAAITRLGRLEQVLDGIEAAREAGFSGKLKLNSVIIKGQNDHEVLPLTAFAVEKGMDITFIEEMPLGHVGRSRQGALITSAEVRSVLQEQYRILDSTENSGGPARYIRLQDHPHTRIGFISPHSNNFCSTCNRVRLTVEGKLLLCLGNENDLDIKTLLRRYPLDDRPVLEAITNALKYKPAKHDFSAQGKVHIVRFMSASGG